MTTENRSKEDNILKYYPVFKYLDWGIPIPCLSIPSKVLILTVLTLILIIVCSLIDHTLLMSGNDVGLFRHPAIWTFLVGQYVGVLSIRASLRKYFKFAEKNELIESKDDPVQYETRLLTEAKLNSNPSRVIYILLITTGLLCFIWNSFQNQAPYKFLGFDFWDSALHPFGYWFTRVYKFWLWIFLIPSLMHLQTSVSLALYKIIKDAGKKKSFRLQPYHQDGYGGAGVLVKIVINAYIPICLVSFLALLSVLFVHGKLGPTPIIGMIILSLIFVLTYLIPAIALKRLISSEKKKQLSEISSLQNTIFLSITKNGNESNAISESETLDSLSKISHQIKEISNWPYMKRVVQLVGLINTPSAISIAKIVIPIVTTWIQAIKSSQ
jgi:hypothetical protein